MRKPGFSEKYIRSIMRYPAPLAAWRASLTQVEIDVLVEDNALSIFLAQVFNQ